MPFSTFAMFSLLCVIVAIYMESISGFASKYKPVVLLLSAVNTKKSADSLQEKQSKWHKKDENAIEMIG